MVLINRMSLICLVLGISLLGISCKNSKESDELLEKGNIHFKNNELGEAMDFYNQSVKANPKQVMAYFNRSLIFVNQNKLADAQKDLEQAVKLAPDFINASYTLAKLYTEVGNLEAGDKLFQKLESKLDTSSAFHNVYGQNFILRNKFPEGEKHLYKALQLDPDNVEALTNLAYSKIVNHQKTEAKDLLSRALKISPDFTFALNNMAILYGEDREFDQAIALLSKIKEEGNLLVKNNIALYYLESGQVAAAKEIIGKISEPNPYSERNLAVLQLKEGKVAEALDKLKNIEASHPDLDHIYYYLGQAYEASGDKTLACENYRKAQNFKDSWAANKCN